MEAFLIELRKHLNGKISQAEVDKTINDYRDYINGELNKGRSYDDVLDELGDPKLLAKSIIVASNPSDNEYSNDNADEIDEETQTYSRNKGLLSQIFNTIKNILVLIIIALIIAGFARFAIYLALIMIVILMIYRLIKNNKD